MPSPIVGLHHVTAIASDPQRNLDFYTQVLGLRFVKRTVNFDDPGSYHFYFGNDSGDPGTILTFFPWPGARRGTPGNGETTAVAFSVPQEALDYWQDRLKGERAADRFGSPVVQAFDPDGMRIELIGDASPVDPKPSRFSDIPAAYAIRGFYSVTLSERKSSETARLLKTMGYQLATKEGSRERYETPGNALGRFVDLVIEPERGYGSAGAGSVHHIAFRATDDAAQLEWRKTLEQEVGVSPVMDRTYFHSIYFREPGGVLFELATDPPGFAFDEPLETLGEGLKLPEWLEPKRAAIEARVRPITLHQEVL